MSNGAERVNSLERIILGEVEWGTLNPPTSHKLMNEIARDLDKLAAIELLRPQLQSIFMQSPDKDAQMLAGAVLRALHGAF